MKILVDKYKFSVYNSTIKTSKRKAKMAIYNPKNDDQLELDKPKTRIVAWSISAVWDNGEEEQITDIPDDVSQPIDDWLTEVEEQQLEFNGEGI